ncbi:MAG: hypothetical protein PUB35_00530 [Campylobacteraceae bacterium]|nr:hypothetical protein [Campylobacteraceae bacterium]
MIFLLLLPFFILIFVVLLPAVWSLAIYGALLIFRSRLRYINETKAKKLLIFGSIATLFIIWELEVPQQVIFNNLTKHSTARYMYDIEIVDDNYTLPVDYKRFGVGYADPYYDCVDYFYKCPLLPMPHQFKHYVDENRNGKKVMIAKLYGPYYGKTFLMMYLENLVVKKSNYRSKYVDDKDIYKKLEILKFKQQKGENNENK